MRGGRWLWLGGLLVALAARPAPAQNTNDLFLVNDSTSVRKISFLFVDTKTFEEEQLKAQIATREPGFWDDVRRALPLLSYDRTKYLLDPIELQRDVVRLRRFYRRNGFLRPFIDYPASQLDTTKNTIHVIFSVREGPALVIQDILFLDPEGRYAIRQFPEPLQPRWRKLRDQIRRRIGTRYTETERVLIRSDVVRWLQDRGYAFARVETRADIDSTAYGVDLYFTIDPGPMAYFGEVVVEGARTVRPEVIRRELPFRPGDRFSSERLDRGQQELFGLNLFRVALVEIPEDQPRDSTVTVRVRVREARPRYVTGQVGWAREDGLSVQADWQHRNLLGGAQRLVASVAWRTGLLALPQGDRQAVRSFNASLSLRQPYVGTTRLSALLSPFLSWYDDENQLGTSFYEVGVNTTLLYELLPFRAVSLQHTFARAVPLDGRQLADTLNVYNRNLLAAAATLGRLNDFQNPRRGYLLRPQLEAAGLLGSGLTYTKGALEGVWYQPLTRRVGMNVRAMVGRLWPLGRSRAQDNPDIEFRFDPIRFYAGGNGDVRGWALQLLGDKFARSAGRDTLYEAVGGVAKMGGSVEVRWPFPGLSAQWGLATFVDAGQVSGRLRRDARGRVIRDASGNPVLGPERLFDPRALKVGIGAGVRYQSAIGLLGFDVGFKVNPDPEDLQDAGARYRFDTGVLPDPPPERFLKRFNLHFSIGYRL